MEENILTQQDLKALAEQAEQAALKAANYISGRHGTVPDVKTKQEVSSRAAEVVTAIDIESERIIVDYLKPSFIKYNLGLLTEETIDDGSRLLKPYFWCIDPLDGTLAFIEKRAGYSVSIALVNREGVPVLGIVQNPSTGAVYKAGLGMQLMKPAVAKGDSTLLHVYFDQSMKFHIHYQKVLHQLETLAKDVGLTGVSLHFGNGSVLNACGVLHHTNAVYFKLPKDKPGGGSFWDFAATACLFAASSAEATDVSGIPLRFSDAENTFMNRRGVIYASNKKLANELVRFCRQFLM
ncbi:MAG: inositol monophosphatase family protein [Bacteroidota bacterium]